MKLGAYDYLTKPVALSELKVVINKAVGIEQLASALGQLVLAAPVMSSHYGDEKLYFRHNMARK